MKRYKVYNDAGEFLGTVSAPNQAQAESIARDKWPGEKVARVVETTRSALASSGSLNPLANADAKAGDQVGLFDGCGQRAPIRNTCKGRGRADQRQLFAKGGHPDQGELFDQFSDD